jgi:hypothetical protein
MSQSAFHSTLRAPDATIPDGLTDARGRPAGRRFNVYRNNVATALMDALETGFPVIRKLLGAENFRNIARDFQWQNPPDSPLMMHYGAGFPDYLAGLPQLARFPYLADVARLELALRHSYHAADHTPLPPETLAATDPDALADPRAVAVQHRAGGRKTCGPRRMRAGAPP